jgi:YD repeat-containing protein
MEASDWSRQRLLSYDSENRLRTATVGATAYGYDYDPLGRRISKSANGSLSTLYRHR